MIEIQKSFNLICIYRFFLLLKFDFKKIKIISVWSLRASTVQKNYLFSVWKAKVLVLDLFKSKKCVRPATIYNEEVEMRRLSSTGAAYQHQTALIRE